MNGNEGVRTSGPGRPRSPAEARMSTVRLTTAQALVRFLAAQYTERDGERRRLIAATWGIFGHGNVAGIGQALVEHPALMPFHQGRNEQAMVHAAVGYARQSRRLSAHAVTTSIGPGATNLVTGAALATVNHLPVLLLPGDTFATRPADPVLQQLQLPYAGTCPSTTACGPSPCTSTGSAAPRPWSRPPWKPYGSSPTRPRPAP